MVNSPSAGGFRKRRNRPADGVSSGDLASDQHRAAPEAGAAEEVVQRQGRLLAAGTVSEEHRPVAAVGVAYGCWLGRDVDLPADRGGTGPAVGGHLVQILGEDPAGGVVEEHGDVPPLGLPIAATGPLAGVPGSV